MNLFELAPLTTLVPVALVALGISYVITGSVIGYWARVVWFALTFWLPGNLETLAFCPSCNAWWGGLVTALLTGSSIWVALQCAFVSCVTAAVVQQSWHLAKQDDDTIRGIFGVEDPHGQS